MSACLVVGVGSSVGFGVGGGVGLPPRYPTTLDRRGYARGLAGARPLPADPPSPSRGCTTPEDTPSRRLPYSDLRVYTSDQSLTAGPLIIL